MQGTGDFMLKSTSILLQEYKDYADPFGKIRRLCRQGNLFQIIRGIYETDGNLPGYLLAPAIYGPSYLSFDYALYRYGLIPERVYGYNSATFGKGRKKNYSNHFGNFTYQDVPSKVFPLGVEMLEEQGYYYSIATPEKALCDKLYTIEPMQTVKNLEILLFDDLRIDDVEVLQFDLDLLQSISANYHCRNVSLFEKFLKGQK